MSGPIATHGIEERVELIVRELHDAKAAGTALAADQEFFKNKLDGPERPHEALALTLEHFSDGGFREALVALTCARVQTTVSVYINQVASVTVYGETHGFSRMRMASYRVDSPDTTELLAELALNDRGDAVLVIRDPGGIKAMAYGTPVEHVARSLV